MKNVLLSNDGDLFLYSVPDEVADHLSDYCLEFCDHWIWETPGGLHFLRTFQGTTIAVYDLFDFIDYLNLLIFPDQPSKLLGRFPSDNVPVEYKDYPYFNF